MQQIFKKELTEFERGDIAVVSVMKNIQKREEMLAQIIEQSKALENQQLEEGDKNDLVDKIELMLRDLRALSIRTVELIVLWRDQFRYLALIGSKQRTLRKRRAQTAI